MKKRKSPILLITLLVIGLGAIVFMNYKPSKDDGHDHGAETPVASQDAQPGAPRTNSPSVKELAQKSKGAAGRPAPPPEAMNPMMKAKQMGMPPDAIPASIENPTAVPQKPKPSDSSIAGQWYAEEARK